MARLRRLIGDPVDRNLQRFETTLRAVNSMSVVMAAADEAELRTSAARLREHARRGASEADLLIETFALVRETAFRVLGQRPFDVQILAGLAMQGGTVVEMQTGEGKTLAAVAPAVLAAWSQRGVHVLTVNDYLARRDAGWMGPVYERLGLRVGFVQQDTSLGGRRDAYRADVTYLTAREAGFDFLRDRLRLEPEDLVQRAFHLAIVDEADSILVDEARVPLVIAGETLEPAGDLGRMAAAVRRLAPGVDYDTDEHARNVNLTAVGSEHLERLIGCTNLYAPEHLSLLALARAALHAEVLLRRDVDYIVRDGQVELVDELTGRVVRERQWPDGLQAAIEAKERLQLRPEGRILGSITMQHFISAYPRMCGMSGTACGAALELERLYGVRVTVIPTNRPCIRIDLPDRIFSHVEAKERAIELEIVTAHREGRPVLVGTASVAESERIAATLRDAGVPCRVLNARNDAEEAEIVAEAGAIGAVTISTNMAGRGTDIRLGGRDATQQAAVVARGGLYVIGTSRQESRRVDDQLRGRAGRQGDPGSSRFFVSVEDDLLQRFGLRDLIPASRWPDRQEEPLDDPFVRREIARAQRIVDGQHYEIRRTLCRYSQVVEIQRQALQDWRQEILRGAVAPGVLAARRADRHGRLTATVGPSVMGAVERRLALVAIDRCWSDHLAEIALVRGGIHLVSLAGQDPYEQFHRGAREAFDRLLRRIDDEIVAGFDAIEVTGRGVDWNAAAMRGPSSTWTYLVSDTPFTTGPLALMAGRPSTGLPVAWLYAPFWIAWGAYRRWVIGNRRRQGPLSAHRRGRAGRRDGNAPTDCDAGDAHTTSGTPRRLQLR